MFSKSAGMKKILLVAVILGIYGLFMCGCGKVSQKVSSNIPNGSNGAEEDVAKPKSSDGKIWIWRTNTKTRRLYWKQWLIFSESLI